VVNEGIFFHLKGPTALLAAWMGLQTKKKSIKTTVVWDETLYVTAIVTWFVFVFEFDGLEIRKKIATQKTVDKIHH
jgi:hypothetical protein